MEEEINLIKGDCLNVMKDIPSESIDLRLGDCFKVMKGVDL